MPFHFPTIFREAIKDSSAIWLVDWKHVKEPQPGTCFSFPTPELAKYSSSSSPYYSRKRHRSSWPLEGQGWGQDRIHNTGSPGEERTSHVEGVCPHPHPLSPAPLRGCPHPHLLTPAPLLSPQQALLPSMEGENAELGDAPPRGRTRLLQSQTLPPGKQIPDSNRNRGNQKVPSLTPNSTTRLG